MWGHFVESIRHFWHQMEKIYGYHEVLMVKELIEVFSVLFAGMIIMYFIDSWFFFQHKKDSVVNGLSAMKAGERILTNPHNPAELLDSYIGIVYLKLFPSREFRPMYPRLARVIIYILITLLIIFTLVGILTADIVTIPYGQLRHVY